MVARMYLAPVVLAASVGLASAKIHPYMYGVPMFAEEDLDPTPLVADVSTASNSTATNSTQPTTTAAPMSSTPGLAEPCAMVSSAVAALPSGARKVIPAEMGLQCLQTVPLDKEGNIKLIDDLKLYVGWQSNLAYLKNPPADYTEDPVDLMGEMDSMQKQLSTGNYKNEYDFQMDLMTLLNRAYDNHLAWQPDILSNAMQFQRIAGTELVSVSTDGAALPEIYSYRDVQLAKNVSSFKPSPIRTINDEGVNEFLQKLALQTDWHDADTRWNSLFPSQSLIAAGTTFLGAFRSGMYSGPNTTLAFANGTSRTDMNVAVVFGDFTGVKDGASFFQKFCTGPQPSDLATAASTTASTVASSTATPAPSHTGYPKPVVINPNLSIGGYFLNDTGYEDLAILAIPSYESPDVQKFQNVMRDFIRMSVKNKKTKLIFDLRGNGGGNAILGYDSFKQVFPQASQEPWGATRYRANDVLDFWGNITSDFDAGKTYAQSNDTAFTENFQGISKSDITLYMAGYNFQHNLNINDEKIGNWDAMFGPQSINGDKFTDTIRYNFSDEASYSYPGFSVIGFLNNSNETTTPQPFAAQNMVMLHDGQCSSTCTIASELLKNQGGVRTIVAGGQPKNAPMQGIGGTKGAQNYQWGDIQTRSQIVFFLGSPNQQAAWNKTVLGQTAFASQLFKRSAYSGGNAAGGINLRDNLRKGDASNTPLEFIYEAADCRMWYTMPMINDVREVWKGAADRMFKNTSCVMGSTGDPTSVSAGGQSKGGAIPPLQISRNAAGKMTVNYGVWTALFAVAAAALLM